jgi:CCR4-NOT transcription complex subunit 7/8
MFAPDSIELLQKSGLDFRRHEEMGIDPENFATLLITSGLVLTDEAKWIGFHRSGLVACSPNYFLINPYFDSGYDFGYLVKILTASSLPTNESEFFDALNTWFPVSFDVKYIMKASTVLKGGLQDVADDLGVCNYFFFYFALKSHFVI